MPEFGVSFVPGGPSYANTGSQNPPAQPIQQAVRFLNLQLPRTGGSPFGAPSLLQRGGPGPTFTPGNPGISELLMRAIQMLAQRFGGGGLGQPFGDRSGGPLGRPNFFDPGGANPQPLPSPGRIAEPQNIPAPGRIPEDFQFTGPVRPPTTVHGVPATVARPFDPPSDQQHIMSPGASDLLRSFGRPMSFGG